MRARHAPVTVLLTDSQQLVDRAESLIEHTLIPLLPEHPTDENNAGVETSLVVP